MQLNSQDHNILKEGVKSRFWRLILEFAQEKQEALKLGILSGLDEERSKSKRNDRDLALAEIILIDELLSIPELLQNRINNQENEV